MKRVLSCAVLVLPMSLLGPRATLSAQATDQAPNSSTAALREYARRAAALGASGVLLVADGERVLLHAAMGWQDVDRVPNDTSTLFYIASLSKQFIAAAVLRLQEERRLRLTDSLGRFFSDVPADKRNITVAQLLTHTSGLPRYGWDVQRRDRAVEDRERAVRGIFATVVTRNPGRTFSYQNSNYVLLTAIAEVVAGEPIETYIERHLTRPAGMRDTYMGARVTDALARRVAWSLGDASEVFSILSRTPSYLAMGRGVVTTAADLHRWMVALHRGRVLSDTSRRTLFSALAGLGPQYGYGGGWYVRTDSSGAPRVVFHGGDFGGYRSEVRFYPSSGRILIALTNASFRGASLTETLLNDLVGVARTGVNQLPSLGAPRPNRLLAGQYVSATRDVAYMESVGGSITVSPVGQRAVDWFVRGDTTGWQRRERAGTIALALVHQLHRGRDSTGGAGVFTPAQWQALTTEWAPLRERGGRLKSYQLLGVVSDDRDRDAAVIRLTFVRDSLLLAIALANDTLAYSAVAIQNPLSPLVFAPTADGRWVSYDWASGATQALDFEGQTESAPTTFTLTTSRGSVVFRRR